MTLVDTASTTTVQTSAVASRLLQIQQIYYEPAVLDYERGREILAQYPDAELFEVESHWKIPELNGDETAISKWSKVKRTVLVLGVKKSLRAVPNSRSSNFIAPSHANGCTMACVYCYVARRKGYANPITTFVNIERICRYLERHAAKQGMKLEPDQVDPKYWVYDIGCNNDCSADALISNNVRDLVSLFRTIPNSKASFATKLVNRDLLNYDPQSKTRIRFSLMPQNIAQIVDVRTSAISDRIAAVNDFVEAGYEVHLNFSPVVYYEGWQEDYQQLFQEIDDVLSPQAKEQLQAEIIFLTHNQSLHERNLEWNPKAEELLWMPEKQEVKYSQYGGRALDSSYNGRNTRTAKPHNDNGLSRNLRYKRNFKRELVDSFSQQLDRQLPYCNIRYAF